MNYNGCVLYDQYVKPDGQITNYRTWVSGVTPIHIKNAKPFKEAKEEAHRILRNKIIVGHSLNHDFSVLELGET